MSNVQKIAKNAGILFVSQIVSYILSFFYTVYITRYLGAEGFGILSFALAFAGIFGVFSDLGLRSLTVREVSRENSLARKYLGNNIVIQIFLGIITIGLATITINVLSYPLKTIEVVYLISLSIVFNAFSGMFYSIFQAYEKMEYQSLGNILNSALMLAGVLIVIYKKLDVVGFSLVYLIVSLIILSYTLIINSWKFVSLKIEIDWNFWKATLKEALPFGLTQIFVTVYFWIDSVMLSLMKGDAAVGWYNAAYRLIMILLFIPSILNMVIFPTMSRLYNTSEKTLILAYEKYFKYMTVLGFPIGVGTTLLSEKIILLIFGSGYKNSIIALQILVWAPVLIYINGAFGRILEASNRQAIITKITIITMLENIFVNLILIPKYSYIGASVATVITEFSSFILLVIFSSKVGYNFSKNMLLDAIKAIVASLLIGILIIQLNKLNLLFVILSAIVLYSIIIYMIKYFKNDDINLFKNGLLMKNRSAQTGKKYK